MSLLATLLDPGFRQAASVLVTVGTDGRDLGPLADLVSLIEIRTARTEAATGTITIDDRRQEDGRWMAADAGLFARWEPVTVTADFGTHSEEVFRGHIVELKPQMPQNGGEAKLVLELQDEGAALNREHMRRLWGEDAPVSDGDILSELIAPLNLSVASGSGEGQSSRTLAMDATPTAFLRERARANGYEIIFSRGEVWFGPMRLDATPQATIMIYAGTATNCLSFTVSDEAQKPDAVTFETAPREEGADPVVETVTPDLPLLGTTAVADEGAGLGTPAIARLSREGDETEEETRARAQALVNEASFRIRATGELDGTLYGHVLQVGLPVRVDGAGERNGGLYYVDKVSHAFTPDGYRQRFELIRNATGDSDSLGGAPLSKALSAIAGLF
ncbi:phage late control D family protein [Rhodobacter sp. CZR27]|uniref:phage late control D family protein n=1 Tax=Rhodobacter sp. CZR27 TaxID=2033869 RepID=UPI000BBEEA08|nr:hypothetical protein [Rhodobacter sp. CZR27]